MTFLNHPEPIIETSDEEEDNSNVNKTNPQLVNPNKRTASQMNANNNDDDDNDDDDDQSHIARRRKLLQLEDDNDDEAEADGRSIFHCDLQIEF